jgi:RimJ/RimL family protein N-acetyltransferase
VVQRLATQVANRISREVDRHLPFLLPSADMIMPVILNTARLTLRPLARADIARLIALANNWSVASRLGRMPHPYGEGEAEAFFATWAEKRAPQDTVLAIANADGLIGCTGLHCHDGTACELGYWLGEPYWGQGYASEAVGALVDHGFWVEERPQITAGHFIDNPASGRVLEKLGFRYIGEARRFCLARGCEVASREMSLSRADWMAS